LSSSEPHYFIVINKNPAKDKILLLVCASSKVKEVEQSRALWRGKTVVKIYKTAYKGFNIDSIVDCNCVFEKGLKDLEGILRSGKLKIKPIMDRTIVDKLIDAVLESDVVEEYIKDMLR